MMFRVHALQRMFLRGISEAEIRDVLLGGEVIEEYPDEQPYPSRLVLVCGTPGADTQMQTNLQVVTHVLDFGMTVAEAVEAPRWRNTQSPTESNVPHVCDDLLHLEARFPAGVSAGLERRGHQLNILGPWAASGSEMMIQVDPDTGVLRGAADPRHDGYAVGW